MLGRSQRSRVYFRKLHHALCSMRRLTSMGRSALWETSYPRYMNSSTILHCDLSIVDIAFGLSMVG